MDTGQRSGARIEELGAPLAKLVPVKGRVSRWPHHRPHVPAWIPSTDPVDPPATLTRPWWHVTAVVVILVALVMGDDGPWIVVVPGLAAVYGPWLDRRISFSFAEGFIGYCLDPEPARDVAEEDEPAVGQRRIPAAS